MAASEVLELVARLRPEGADETTDALEDVQDTFEETADTAEQSADDLEGFSNRFEGAVGVAAGALAVAAGGLLSTVPIVGDAFAAIGAIIDSFGLQVDQLLRDLGAGGIVGRLFEWADAIANADGELGDFLGTLGLTTITIGGVITAIGAYVAAVNTFTAGSTTFVAAASGIVSAIAGIVSAIPLIPAALAIAFAAVVGFAAAYITNWNNIRDKTDAILNDILVSLPEPFRTGLSLIANVLRQGGNILFGIWEFILNQIINKATSAINGIVSTIVSGVNQAINALNRLEGVNISEVAFGGISGPGNVSFERLSTRSNQAIIRESQRRLQNRQVAQRGQDTNQELIETLRQLRRSKENPPDINIDGRKVSGATSEFRGQNAAFRGR